jgi:hypothetical protein
MTASYFYAGIMMILIGLFEIFLTPVILKRLWQGPIPRSAYVIRMTRMSGVIVLVLGLLFLSGALHR